MKTPAPTIVVPLVLIFIGTIFIAISSLAESQASFGDSFFYLKRQLFWLIISVATFAFASLFKIDWLKKLATPIYLVSIALLIAVLIPGIGSKTLGAQRWINLGLFSLQPGELVKLTSLIFLAKLFSLPQKVNLTNLIIYLILPFVLIILQPNLSTALLVVIIVISIYFAAGGPLFSLVKIGLPAAIILTILILTSPYRSSRLKTLISGDQNSPASYHSRQIIITIGSGGFSGKGFANSAQKYNYLPKITTDSILAIIGEETGFVGISFIIVLYLILINYLLKLAKKLEGFGNLFCTGLATWISFQTLINMSAMAGIIPLTGIPLPLISYGGSSLSTLAFALGIAQNFDHQQKLLYSTSDNHQNHRHHRQSPHPRSRIHSSAPRR